MKRFVDLGAMLHGIELMTFDHVLVRTDQLISRYQHIIESEIVRLDALQDIPLGGSKSTISAD